MGGEEARCPQGVVFLRRSDQREEGEEEEEDAARVVLVGGDGDRDGWSEVCVKKKKEERRLSLRPVGKAAGSSEPPRGQHAAVTWVAAAPLWDTDPPSNCRLRRSTEGERHDSATHRSCTE